MLNITACMMAKQVLVNKSTKYAVTAATLLGVLTWPDHLLACWVLVGAFTHPNHIPCS